MPAELTRTLPRPVFATPTVADCPLAVFGAACAVELPPLPQPAKASDASSTAAALAMKVNRWIDHACPFAWAKYFLRQGSRSSGPCCTDSHHLRFRAPRIQTFRHAPKEAPPSAFAPGSPHELVGSSPTMAVVRRRGIGASADSAPPLAVSSVPASSNGLTRRGARLTRWPVGSLDPASGCRDR